VKVHDKFSYIPIIVLTGLNEIDFAIKTIQNGAQDYLIKGDFDKKVLAKAIQYAIERKKIANDYTRIFNESPVPMYIFDSETFKFLSINTAALEQYGYTRDEFLTLTIDDIRPKKDAEAFRKAINKKNERYMDVGQWRHIRKNGGVFFVHIYAHNTTFEGKNAWINSAINIDKKVAAENALIEKTRETENILQSITDGFYTLNNEWKFTYVNKETERTLNHTKEELIGKSIWEVFPEAKQLKFYSEYQCAKKEKISVHFQEKFTQLGIWVSVNAYPTKEGLTVYFVDVTEQRNHLDMIEQQNKRLKEIAWIQSHEVRSPVASIMGLIQVFNIDNPADPLNREILENIKEATGKLDEITRIITNHTFIASLA
jgi:PAS domain S-box-containing protein